MRPTPEQFRDPWFLASVEGTPWRQLLETRKRPLIDRLRWLEEAEDYVIRLRETGLQRPKKEKG